MPRWRVDYIGKGRKHLGTVEAPDQKEAITEAMKTFTSRRQDGSRWVTKIETRDK